jgi:TM2 domain-containing membrane protein YozV
MDCVNHSGVSATAFCQTCGKPLCASCVRSMAGGQIFCDACQASWQAFQQPFVVPPPDGPNPTAAAVLGLIPGVGAMYNGQYFKALIHVVIFAVLISMADHYGIFGIFIAAWVLYQSFEDFHTAKARRDGLPTPDPLGLNEVGNWLNLGAKPPYPGQPGPSAQGPAQGAYPQPPAAGQYQAPYQAPYQTPYAPPAAGYVDPGIPPVPPVPPSLYWRRKEPIGAIVLIALGVLFLLGQLDLFHGRMFEFAWPVLLIGLGIWLVVRRLAESQGGSK